jgi:hypothetical protein
MRQALLLVRSWAFVGLAAAFALTLAGTAQTADLAAPKVEGWSVSGEVRTFGPDTLYEQIDGASELYLSYGFRSLMVMDYARGDDVVTVEIYDHGSPERAFGIYSQERPREGHFLDVGAEGYLEPPILSFTAGNAYVKLNALDTTPATPAALESLARGLAEAIAAGARLPEALALFPAEGKVPHSERFANQDFLGYACLHSAFTADYTVDTTHFQAFIIELPTTEEASSMSQGYLEAASDGTAPRSLPDGGILVADKYNGPVALWRHGPRLTGTVGLDNPQWAQVWNCHISGPLGPDHGNADCP